MSYPAGRSWARYHAACVQCGTTEKPHEGRGLCRSCYSRQPDVKQRAKAEQLRYRNTQKGRATIRRLESKRGNRADYRSDYFKRPEIVAMRREWDARPENKAKRAAYMKTEHARSIMRRVNHERRTRERSGDITATQELRLRKGRTFCPLCRKKMTEEQRQKHSKHLDHIVPINQGGRHTMSNVRIICATCNKSRPRDGSDFIGQLSLEAVA